MSMNIRYEKKDKDIYYGISDGRSRLHCAAHLHRDLELILYRSGETLATADSRRHRLMPGDLFLTFPNQIHSYETEGPEDFSIMILKPDLLPELADEFELSVPESAVLPGGAANPRINALFDAVVEICCQPEESVPYRKEKLHGYLLAMFAEILSGMKLVGLPADDSGALRSIIFYCTRHYAGDLSLSVLSDKLGLNRYYISHLFSKRLGMCFNDYVNSLRISEACRMLLNSDDSVTDICFHVGFGTLRTFNRAFVRHTGKTPSEYRKNATHTEAAPTHGGKAPPLPPPVPAPPPPEDDGCCFF